MSSDDSDNDFDPAKQDEKMSDGGSDDGEESEESPKKKASKRKIASDESDEIDSEEEEERTNVKKRKKKNRRPRGMDFILDDVEVESDDAEEEDYDSDEGGVMEPREREEAEKRIRQLEAERRKTDEKRAAFMNLDEDEIEKYFNDKYKSTSSGGANFDDDDALDDISQHGLLPSTKDPNLWIVKCRMGEEKFTAMQLMRKAIAHANTDNPLQIKSVTVKEGLKGIIYIEAYKQSHVLSAIEGIAALNQFNVTMVPIKEMVEVLRVVNDIPQLKTNSYVRMKRTMFKDDLAQVDTVDMAAGKVYLRLLPRIDYTRMRGALRTDADKLGTKKKMRPPPKPFDVDKIKEIGGDVNQDGDFMQFEGNSYRRGFLYKAFPLNVITTEGVKPTLAELEKFQDSSDDLKKELEKSSISEGAHSFAPGDMVEVAEGELVNLRGKIQSVDGDKIVIQPDHEELKDLLTLNAWELRKLFKQGDHVKVLTGRYEGDTGLVVRVESNQLVVLSDLSMHEMKVRPRDCQVCADVTTGVDSHGQLQFHDLVQIDPATVGVITRLERDAVEVLNMHGKSMRVKPQAIQARKASAFAQAMDSQNNSLQVKDVVKVVDGPFATKRDREEEKQGEVLHIFRIFVFVHSRKHTENGGIFVCKARHLLLAGAVRKSTEVPTMNRLLSSPNPYLSSPRHPGAATPAHSSSRSTVGGQTPAPSLTAGPMGMPKGQGARRDMSMIGKNVKIVGGPMKGYFGIVKDCTEDTVRVEMHANCKTINVDRARVSVVGDDSSVGSNAGMTQYTRTPAMHDGKTPMYGAGNKTPMYGGANTPMYGGSKTPMYGSQTPMHDGGRTPHYGAQTPAYDGGRTPAYGAGDGGRTPAYGADGGRTPAYGDRTPAWEGSSTPRVQPKHEDLDLDGPSSPTYNAPTPGGMSLNPKTPGGGYMDYAAPSPMPRSYAANASIPSHFLETGDWVVNGLAVRITAHDDDRFQNEEGIVIRIDDGRGVTLAVPELRKQCFADYDAIIPVRPMQGEMCRVIYGDEFVGQQGVLESEDAAEGVLRMPSGDMTAVPLSFLCKVVHHS